jgi:predicted SAM-dependent methyltransferase
MGCGDTGGLGEVTATPQHVSETSKHRDWFLPHTQGYGMDVGFGGDPLTPNCITFDMPQPYTSVGTSVQHLGGDARSIPLKDGTLDWLYNSHLIEDFTYADQIPMVKEWLRVLKPGGRLLILAPDQQRFLAHCAATGQPINEAHKEADYSLKTFKKRVLKAGNIRDEVWTEADFDDYSWAIVLEKNL